jgi:hypothetical protein
MMIPKPHRIVNKDLLKRIKNNGICQIPGCYGFQPYEPHHIKSKGSGGDDVSENIVRLCFDHHRQAHNAKFDKEYLRELALQRIREEGE